MNIPVRRIRRFGRAHIIHASHLLRWIEKYKMVKNEVAYYDWVLYPGMQINVLLRCSKNEPLLIPLE